MNILKHQLTIITSAIASLLTITPPVLSQTTIQPNKQTEAQRPPHTDRGAPDLTGGNGSRAVPSPPRSDRGAPDMTGSSGSRGAICEQSETAGETPLTALMPKNNKGITITSSPHPSVSVYSPATESKNAQFRIIDIEAQAIVEGTNQTFTLPDTPSLVKINLPQTVTLQPGKRYQWQFLIICDPDHREDNQLLEGKLERITLNPEQQANIEQAAPQSLEQAALYTEAEIWLDAVDILANLRDQNPEAQKQWTELLETLQLGDISQSPIVNIP